MCELSTASDTRRVLELNAVVVSCRECGRTRMIFPNERAKPAVQARAADAYITGLYCSGCRSDGRDGKRVLAAPVWQTPEAEAGRDRMARLLQPTRCGARL